MKGQLEVDAYPGLVRAHAARHNLEVDVERVEVFAEDERQSIVRVDSGRRLLVAAVVAGAVQLEGGHGQAVEDLAERLGAHLVDVYLLEAEVAVVQYVQIVLLHLLLLIQVHELLVQPPHGALHALDVYEYLVDLHVLLGLERQYGPVDLHLLVLPLVQLAVHLVKHLATLHGRIARRRVLVLLIARAVGEHGHGHARRCGGGRCCCGRGRGRGRRGVLLAVHLLHFALVGLDGRLEQVEAIDELRVDELGARLDRVEALAALVDLDHVDGQVVLGVGSIVLEPLAQRLHTPPRLHAVLGHDQHHLIVGALVATRQLERVVAEVLHLHATSTTSTSRSSFR